MTLRRRERIRRRELLAGCAVALGGGLAGCSMLGFGCDSMHESSIETERETPPEDGREALSPIRVADLPPGERDIARKAIQSGSYSECSPVSEAFESLLDRISEHRDEQQRRSEADLATVYFLSGGAYYAITAFVLDQGISY